MDVGLATSAGVDTVCTFAIVVRNILDRERQGCFVQWALETVWPAGP